MGTLTLNLTIWTRSNLNSILIIYENLSRWHLTLLLVTNSVLQAADAMRCQRLVGISIELIGAVSLFDCNNHWLGFVTLLQWMIHWTSIAWSTTFLRIAVCILDAKCTVSRVKTEFASLAFLVAAPQIWNDLPVNLKSGQSVHIFKYILKTFLFDCASNWVNRRDLNELAPQHLRIYGAI